MPSHLILTGSRGNTPLRFELREGLQVVGRQSDCDIPILDTAVSRKHAELTVEQGEVKVRDLGSTNGSFLNGTRFTDEVGVKPGDRLRFGHVNLTLLKGGTSILSNQFAPEGSVPATLTTTFQEIRAETRENQTEQILAALHEAGQMLSQRIELKALYQGMVDFLARFIKASRILILEKETDEGDVNILASRLMGSVADEPLKMSRTFMKAIVTDGQSILTKDASLDQRFSAHESIIQSGVIGAMGAPLFDNDRILGAIYVDSKIPGIEYTAENLKLLTLLANMIAVKITNSRLEESELALKEIQRELAVAERIQRSLLPQQVPVADGYRIFCHQTPCSEVGGDLYDIRLLSDGRMWIALGDVTGHGVGAAILMSHVMAGLQILEDAGHAPLELVHRLETHLLQHVQSGQFVTLFVGILDPATGHLQYVNAGHNPPLILRDGKRAELPSTGMAVAMLPGQKRTTAEVTLAPGETLLVFSDGIPETQQGEKQFDEERFYPFLDEARAGGYDADTLGRKLLDEVTAFRGDGPVGDDLTLVVVERT